MTRRRLALLLVALAFAGCRQDMHDQPRLETNSASTFFANGTSVRPLVDGVVPRDAILGNPALTEGKTAGGDWVTQNPRAVDAALLERGRERFNIYCSPCHGAVGDGAGMIVKRGYPAPPSLHEARLREAADGYLFDVITNGYGIMYPYRAQVRLEDRWAIVAYIRALQLSQDANVAQLPEADVRALEATTP